MPNFTVDGVEYPLVTQRELTFGELELIEEVAGQPLGEIESKPTTKALMAFVLVSMRRVNPDASLDDVRKAGVTVLDGVAGEAEADADPPSAPATVGAQQ